MVSHGSGKLLVGREPDIARWNYRQTVPTGDQRVKVADGGLYTYSDVTVVCEKPLFDDAARATLLNPLVIVEVLSPSAAAYDRGEKFEFYRQLPSLQEYVLVASDRMRIERYTRQNDGASWLLQECRNPAGALELPSIGCTLALARVCLKVEFPPQLSGRG